MIADSVRKRQTKKLSLKGDVSSQRSLKTEVLEKRPALQLARVVEDLRHQVMNDKKALSLIYKQFATQPLLKEFVMGHRNVIFNFRQFNTHIMQEFVGRGDKALRSELQSEICNVVSRLNDILQNLKIQHQSEYFQSQDGDGEAYTLAIRKYIRENSVPHRCNFRNTHFAEELERFELQTGKFAGIRDITRNHERRLNELTELYNRKILTTLLQ